MVREHNVLPPPSQTPNHPDPTVAGKLLLLVKSSRMFTS